MEKAPQKYDEEWRKASVSVYADLKGLLAFRQFRLTSNPYPYYGPFMRGPRSVIFEDDFTLASIFAISNWRPRKNVAVCNVRPQDHAAPDYHCTCGFYASYSSTIIYHPELLVDKYHCFGAVRMYGNDLPLAQNGLRSAGANVDGLLLRPESRGVESIRKFIKKLEEEDIFYTFSANEFIRQFPDQSYSSLLKFDPIERLANLSVPNSAELKNVSYKFCRPLRDEMIMYHPETSEISLRPEYRPGGRLYRHPLLEAWPD